MSHWSRGVQTRGVRFWNLTASQPASAAAVDQRQALRQVAVVVDADLAGDVHRVSDADHAVAERAWRCGNDPVELFMITTLGRSDGDSVSDS